MHNVVVIGAGKIGSMIAERLAGCGDYAVTVVDRSAEQLARLETGLPVVRIAADITDGARLVKFSANNSPSSAPPPTTPRGASRRQPRRPAPIIWT